VKVFNLAFLQKSTLNPLTMNLFSIKKWGFAMLVASAGIAACTDEYLEITPQNLTDDAAFFSSSAKAQEALNSAYDALAFDNFLSGHCQFLAELMADNIDGARINNSDWLAHYTWTTDIFLGTTFSVMQDGYRPVGRANYLIDKIDLVPGLGEADKKRLLAEAKFVRAVSHFELVRLFAQPYGYTADNSHLGIPLRTKFGRDLIPRATVQQVYDQIISDLNEAAANLPASNNGYATSWAAKGYLAKVYFQMNRFEDALRESRDLALGNAPFQLDTSVILRFRQNDNPENIFALRSSDFDSDNSGKRFRDNYRQDASTKIAAAYASASIYESATLDPNDQRGKQWYLPAPFGPLTVYAVKKFPTERADGAGVVPLVSMSEIALIFAESAAERNTDLALAAAQVEAIQSRAGVAPNCPAEATLIIEKAREQRRLELVFEGNRLHELKRQAVRGNTGLRVRNVAPWNCPGLVCQFPAGELQANAEVEPNPTGGCQ
jgi:hypothetical protein